MSSILSDGALGTSFRTERLVVPSELSLPDCVVRLSYALDVAHNVTEGRSHRTCRLALKLAERIGLSERQKTALYFVTCLGKLGRTTYAQALLPMLSERNDAAESVLRLFDSTSESSRTSVETSEMEVVRSIARMTSELEAVREEVGIDHALELMGRRQQTAVERDVVRLSMALRREDPCWTSHYAPDAEPFVPQSISMSLDEETILKHFDGLCHAFAAYIDSRSRWTDGHSFRVAEIVDGTARELGCSPEVRQDLRRAALLHDIGKLSISDTLLNTTTRPTREEFVAYRKHAAYTWSLLKHLPGCYELARAAGGHHERLDGRGYPCSLAGQEISWGARMLAAADAFEMLSACRPYRPAMSFEQVRDIMLDDADVGLDAICVAALLRWFESSSFERRVDNQWQQIDDWLDEVR